MSKNHETLWMILMKLVYGVAEPVDEYKKSEINRIGNNAFIIALLYGVISTFIYIFSLDQMTKEHFLIVILANVLVYFLGLPLYISIAAKRAHLMEIDLDKNEYPRYFRRTIIHGIFVGLGYGIGVYLLRIIISFTSNRNVFETSTREFERLLGSLGIGLLFGTALTLGKLVTLKRAVEQAKNK
ncbi:DUF3278 domain-containing protein [Lapidilactobacillus bayanensis]|uniref:DUF3278 domain-containing protein n=1 Tax=Lapidilactobacillus bayanensis TaxID=2485998 RepID=UPI000F78A78A|nr:DUF3278 domain-containing protein [Lapidilactobacillus bayanensis]